jgi:PIN domain nuclease of toxin-antitoxin system
VRLLLDTQCWLFWFLHPERLNRQAQDLIIEQRHPVYLSAASSWEIAIKAGMGRLKLPETPAHYVPSRLADAGMSALAVEHVHALAVAELPPRHADPFDRLLVAQAAIERMTLLTTDPQIMAYPEAETLWSSTDPAPPRVRRRRGR